MKSIYFVVYQGFHWHALSELSRLVTSSVTSDISDLQIRCSNSPPISTSGCMADNSNRQHQNYPERQSVSVNGQSRSLQSKFTFFFLSFYFFDQVSGCIDNPISSQFLSLDIKNIEETLKTESKSYIIPLLCDCPSHSVICRK